jgi:hypothetical protein
VTSKQGVPLWLRAFMVFCVLTVVAMGAATWRYGNSIHHHRMEAMQAWDRFNGAQQPAAVILESGDTKPVPNTLSQITGSWPNCNRGCDLGHYPTIISPEQVSFRGGCAAISVPASIKTLHIVGLKGSQSYTARFTTSHLLRLCADDPKDSDVFMTWSNDPGAPR